MSPGGRRRGLDLSKPSPWAARLAVLAVVAVAWAALWASRPAGHTARRRTTAAPSLGTAPIDTGETSFCPAWTYGAYRSSGSFVPPNYPGVPPSGSPVRCFSSPAEAVRAGFHPAETPSGDLVVDGVYLVPTTVALGATCSRAAIKLGYAVPCPGMLPNPPPFGASPHCGKAAGFLFPANPSCVANLNEFAYDPYTGTIPAPSLAFVFGQGAFAAPPSWVGPASIASSGIVIVAAPRTAARSLRSLICSGNVTSTVAVLGHRATVRECHNDRNATAETVLAWTQQGIVYEVAILGPDGVDATPLAEAIASHVELIPAS